ncbi:MAG: hypothetical protein QXY45_02725, partial [Candidatus Aenigmatarchaeota archaeon]
MGRPITLVSLFFILTFFTSVYSVQKTFVLDPSNPVFRFEEFSLNNTNKSEELIFSGKQNITRYIRIPKNSTIIDSNITLIGKIIPSQTVGSGVAFYSVAVGNVTGGSKNDIVIGTITQPHVILYNSSLSKIWDFNTTGSGIVRSISVGDVNLTSSGDEVAIASEDQKVYLLNKSGNLIWYYDLGSPVRAVYIENITKDNGKEVVCGGDDLKISVLNSSGNLKWYYTIGNVINTIAVGEVDSENEGNEIVLGAGNSIYIL